MQQYVHSAAETLLVSITALIHAVPKLSEFARQEEEPRATRSTVAL